MIVLEVMVLLTIPVLEPKSIICYSLFYFFSSYFSPSEILGSDRKPNTAEAGAREGVENCCTFH